MTTSAHRLTKKEARAQLSAFLEQLCLENLNHLDHPASMIGKAMFRGFDLGLSMVDAHAVVRSHLHKHQARHKRWWTADLARVAWERAKCHEAEGIL